MKKAMAFILIHLFVILIVLSIVVIPKPLSIYLSCLFIVGLVMSCIGLEYLIQIK